MSRTEPLDRRLSVLQREQSDLLAVLELTPGGPCGSGLAASGACGTTSPARPRTGKAPSARLAKP